MKKLPCKYPKCGDRRRNHEDQDTPRGQQMIEVPDDIPEYDPIFCSLTCAISDGWLAVKYEDAVQTDIRRMVWYKKDDLRRQAADIEAFKKHLKRASEEVAKWPEWKRNLLVSRDDDGNSEMRKEYLCKFPADIDEERHEKQDRPYRNPQAPEILVNAFQDKVHRDLPQSRPAKSKKIK